MIAQIPQKIDNYIKNMSTASFTTDELNLLDKGLNYGIQPIKPKINETIIDLEVAIQSIPQEHIQTIRHNSKVIIEQHISTYSQNRNTPPNIPNSQNNKITQIKKLYVCTS